MILSSREKDVMNLICEGLTNSEIANRLFVSVHTVKAHVESIMNKCQSKSRAGAVYLYCKENLFNN